MPFEIYNIVRSNYGKGFKRGNVYEIEWKGNIVSRVWQDTWEICIEVINSEPIFIKKDLWKINYSYLNKELFMKHPISFGSRKTELFGVNYRFKIHLKSFLFKTSTIDCTILQDDSEVMKIHVDKQRGGIFTSIDRIVYNGWIESCIADPLIVSALILSFNDHAESIERST